MPSVSVIIPAFNNVQFVTEAVKSALDQTYTDYEIIVVDDGSTDNTKEILRGYGDKIRCVFQENRGLPAARNAGIRLSKGKYLQFLDADDVLLPDKLKCQVEFLESNPDYGVVYSDVRLFHDFDRKHLIKPTYDCYSGDILRHLVRNNFMFVDSVLIRRECLRKAGLFCEDLISLEDWDLWLRVAYLGFKFYHLGKILSLHRLRENSMINDKLTMTIAGVNVIERLNRYVSPMELRRSLGIDVERSIRHYILGIECLNSGMKRKGYREISISHLLTARTFSLTELKTIGWALLKLVLGAKNAERLLGNPEFVSSKGRGHKTRFIRKS